MISIRKNICIVLSLIGLGLQSCDKLDMAPTDSIDPSKAFRNLDDVNMGVLGAYAPLSTTLLEAGAIVSDEVLLPTENTVSNTALHRWMYNSSYGSVTSAWNEYYVVIDRVNHVLEALPNITVTGNNQILKNQYEAELLALRAYSHFELLRGYASSYDAEGMGVPYMKARALGYPARPTVKSNYEDINADLQAAKDLMPTSFTENIRITKTAISAIQARVALYAKNWPDAIKYASEVISAEPLAPKNDFPKIWVDNSNSEVVWKLARVIGDSRLGAAFYREAGGIVLYAPSSKLINTFNKTDDIRYAAYIKDDPSRVGPPPSIKSQYLVNKYIGGNTTNPGLTDVKIFRTGEMVLIRAEAEAESNSATGLTNAANDLNTLRRERIHNYVNQTFSSKQILLENIYNERFKELAFEGHRFYDLKRLKLPVERLTQDAANTSGAVKLEPTAAQYCFPIPNDEMAVNKNMVQNPKYGKD
ncbi:MULTISPECIES: RagB/SusD family nutrient uptake outer membrane protein [Sphingobacterium]|uniref:RagB/SusD family nutrient uptake outer membrane protein n=1 Tax=Sphingobacterium litopenaei TaxID=2763500 RepID=A0ABR7YCS6_9SPHI|nr:MULTISPECIES: RagB/SusD family nutrient uptake outer membrane protein [Sphingobacterium]MBD1429094.1 RagB/SusD family nutrient uptake outer membrane protein [Sphingobacterium litopenaei]NGM73872.1 RagB/SusD family nutrient uptake outer membrane protein [Sphingobacterium sp. SGL-16]